jgi:hypothetical protein
MYDTLTETIYCTEKPYLRFFSIKHFRWTSPVSPMCHHELNDSAHAIQLMGLKYLS